METAKIRLRPLRFAFLVEQRDKKSLQRVFEVNSSLWGGIFNFIIPLFKSVPARYHERYQKPISAKAMLQGFIEAFQPDFIIETKPGQAAAYAIDFPDKRTGSIDKLLERDEEHRCKIGVDLRSVCDDMYDETFRFVQRFPPKVFIPSCKDKRYRLLFAAMFGALPEEGPLAEVADIYLKALEGNRQSFAPLDFPKVFDQDNLFPLRVTKHKLTTYDVNWSGDGVLFYMNETSSLDLIEYWNYRALGWKIAPLPVSLAPKLTAFCEEVMRANHRPFPPPSNAWHSTSYLCAYGQPPDAVQAFLGTLKIPDGHFVSTNPHVPRIWEEWGRSADQARPQIVTHASKSTDARDIGNGLHLDVLPHEFADEDRFCSRYTTSVNVIESLSGAMPVIPWNRNVASKLTYNFGEEKTWISREGITFVAGDHLRGEYTRLPSPLNIFKALAEASGSDLSLSPAGRTCEQIIASLGGLLSVGLVARSKELLDFLNSLAHEDLEADPEEPEGQREGKPRRKRPHKAFAPYNQAYSVVRRSNPGNKSVADSHLGALVHRKVLKIGMKLTCPECQETRWFSLEDLASTLPCPHCFTNFPFPTATPPDRKDWAYRVIGPFATYGFAKGSYCVASALQFLKEKVAFRASWIPSFVILKDGKQELEADFGMFVMPGATSHISTPYLILGECKSFDRFDEKDYARARKAAKLFPGAVLCFCTFNESLNQDEVKGIKKIVEAGRDRLDVGKQLNPVLILTATELFGQFNIEEFSSLYKDKEDRVNRMIWRQEIDEICEFTQERYLGMPSSHEVRQERYKKRLARKAARQAKKANVPNN
jgi:hypothetical protein